MLNVCEEFCKILNLIIFDGGLYCYLSPSNQGTVTVRRLYKVDNVTRARLAITGLLRGTLTGV